MVADLREQQGQPALGIGKGPRAHEMRRHAHVGDEQQPDGRLQILRAGDAGVGRVGPALQVRSQCLQTSRLGARLALARCNHGQPPLAAQEKLPRLAAAGNAAAGVAGRVGWARLGAGAVVRGRRAQRVRAGHGVGVGVGYVWAGPGGEEGL